MTPFHKYQGTGNDFILIDDRDRSFGMNKMQIEKLCHRRFGIGADGLILLQEAEGFDFRMLYYNADGEEGSMCGNGGRCIVRFAHDLGIFSDTTRFMAVDGVHEATVIDENISLKMADTSAMLEKDGLHYYDTGSPHVVEFVSHLDNLNVVEKGREIRYNPYWKSQKGTNVNFVEIISKNEIKVRTYERGVEDETYSCGTGVTACALDYFVREGEISPMRIITLGGVLNVSFNVKTNQTFEDIYLTGPAKMVFKGIIEE